jgi:LuxR family quorum sensing-dependent transcriptional regulator
MFSETVDFSREALELTEKLEQLPDGEAVADALFNFVQDAGAETLFLSAMPQPHESLDELVMASRLRPGWFDLYTKEQFVLFDPIIHRLWHTRMPFEWRELEDDSVRGSRAAEVMDRRRDFALLNGLTVPICGPSGVRGLVSIAGEHIRLTSHFKRVFHLTALYAFTHIRKLCHHCPGETAPLTRREREVLIWTAHGKSAWQVGEILSITKRTVDEHIQNATHKLHAANKTHAVAVALHDGIIKI